MPEIKHQFTGGKMNKDLDERLVPNGEYRDAMNIQVSTSEGSHVGTIQNILGNTHITGPSWTHVDFGLGARPINERCVASVADEKNDVGYYFIAGGENFEPFSTLPLLAQLGTYPYHSPDLFHFERDMIIRFDGTSTTPVFVDMYLKTAICSFANQSPDGKIVLNAGNPFGIEAGDIITRIETSTAEYDDLNIPILAIITGKILIQGSDVTNGTLLTEILTSVINTDNQLRIVIDRRDSRVLKFDVVEGGARSINKLITGINIIDDLLFWTDGYTEPKKINIDRSIKGTVDGFKRTKIVINDITSSACEESHVTVIKKRPNKAPTISALTSFRQGVIFGEFDVADAFGAGGTPLPDGSIKWIAVDNDNVTTGDPTGTPISFEVGDILRFTDDNNELPPQYFKIRASVVDGGYPGPHTVSGIVVGTIGQTALKIEIESMSEEGLVAASLSGNQTWYVGLEELGKTLFEQKLPRFSSRYKYEDNEYSAPGPFSEVVFIPGDFRYHPTEAYNTGMVNNLRELTLQDFIPSDLPKDVIQVDLLYKNETSPNIYTIESITREDTMVNGNNSWTSPGSKDGLFGSYKVSTENIYSTLPSNQLLRPWDNVPRTALAQEVSGNRVIYGNYLQNYDLIKAGSRIVPNIETTIGNRINNNNDNRGRKSIKSLRSYDVGVIWGDQYGRETPIITPSSGSTLVPKTKASYSNSLNIELDGNHPDWADYYKIFVKETSNEYYNLAMDRVYDAEDGNVWISFPSIDRNKVDEDTYLVLKKGINTEDAIEEEARYKIVAIENEAPDYIKTSYELLAESNDDASRRIHTAHLWGGNCCANILPALNSPYNLPSAGKNAPIPGQKGFSIDYDIWTKPWNSTNKHYGLADLAKLFDDIKTSDNKDLLVSFSRNDVARSVFGQTKKYKVVNLTHDDTAECFMIDIDEPILANDGFVTNDIADGSDYAGVHFWERKIENKPEFDGRFFVKINSDSVSDDKLIETQTIDTNWMVNASTVFYNIEDTSLNHNNSTNSFSQALVSFPNYYAQPGNSPTNNGSAYPKTENSWKHRLRFGGSTIKSGWFIDKASFAGEQPDATHDYSDAQTKWNFNPDHVESCDTSTTNNMDFTYTTPFAEIDACPFMDCSREVGTGMSTGVIGMRGAYDDGGSNFLDLSYSKIGPSLGTENSNNGNDEPNFTVGEDAQQFLPTISASTNSHTDEEKDVVKSLKPQQRFRIKGDPTIYKIISVGKKKLYNYKGATTEIYKVGITVAGIDMYSYNDNWDADHLNISKDTNRRVRYRIKYEVDLDAAPDPFQANTDGYVSDWGHTSVADVSLPANPVFANVNGNPNTIENETIEFISEFDSDKPSVISSNPAIFETEPKEDADLDIYYEATNRIPTKLTEENQELFIPIGAILEVDASIADVVPEGIFVTGWEDPSINQPNTLILSTMLTLTQFQAIAAMPEIKFVRDDGSFTSVTSQAGPIVNVNGVNMVYALTVEITNKIGLGWFNCWSFNNGVESNRIGDTYNKPFITNGVKVSSVIVGNYEEEKRINGLIYSGIYNPNSNTNELNQFIAAEKITKDLNPTYGSIQKLYSQTSAEGDLVALCEDRVLKILANKDALYNADGNPQLISTNNVLGRAIPFSGEYGISKNPESFASEAYRAYFTDKVRGTVMRLSKDGLTPVSSYGMKDWFRDNLKLANKLIGSYDDKKDEYNITLKEMGDFTYTTTSEIVLLYTVFANMGTSATDTDDILHTQHMQIQVGDIVELTTPMASIFFLPSGTVVTNTLVGASSLTITLSNQVISDGNPYPWQPEFTFSREIFTTTQDPNSNPSKTVSFKEDVKGWVSFKSFFPENAISVANEYYTFLNGNLWKHHEEGSITSTHPRNTFYNVSPTPSSFNVILNDLPGSVKSFKTINYEGSQSKVDRLVNYPVYNALTGVQDGSSINDNEYYNLTDIPGWYVENIKTDKQQASINEFIEKEGKWFNYIKGDPTITTATGGIVSGFDTDDFALQGIGRVVGISFPPVPGCTDPYMFNYTPWATIDDGSCIAFIYGCMDPAASNQNPLANTDDGSCAYPGCTDPYAINYDPNATVDDGSCIAIIFGCTNPTACNYDSYANIDDGNCLTVYGCTNSQACNYDPMATCDDDSCMEDFGCTDPNACNYQNEVCTDNSLCNYCSDVTADNFGNDCVCLYCMEISNFSVMSTSINSITLQWTTVTPANINSYTLTMTSLTAPDYTYTLYPNSNGMQDWNSSTPSYTVSPLQSGTDYYFTIQSNCQTTTSAPSNTLQATTSLIAVYPGCTDPIASNYNPLADVDDGSCLYPLAIGDTHQGGTIFWLDGTGGGLIVSPTDQSTGAEWGCGGSYSGASGIVIGTGAQNTIDINTTCTTPGIAADICENLTLGGYSDWFLPSKDELNEMYLTKSAMSASFYSSLAYWSSTEYSNTDAWYQTFGNGIQFHIGKSSSAPNVRAIRAF